MSQGADLLIVNAAEVLTCADFSRRPASGPDQGRVGIIPDGAVAIAGGRILEVGQAAHLRKTYPLPGEQVIDAQGGVVLPGFVDAHTHMVFAGHRAGEWEARMRGKPYLEILREGGGILSTVEATRAASFDLLLENSRRWARRCLSLGTTTIEVKSGYGLDRDNELKQLEVAGALAEGAPPRIVATFLGAHVLPPEYADDREGYLKLVEQIAEEVRRRELAADFDVFCEEGAFTLAESERLLLAAKGLGFGLKLHAEQITSTGAAALGARLGARSIDHLEQLDERGLNALANAETIPIAVLLPAVNFHLGQDAHAPARMLINAGIPVALATDFNPGSAFSPSIPMVIALATRLLGMSVAEAIVATTINAAHALGIGAETGSLEPGKRADLIICDVPDHRWLGYGFGWNPVRVVIAGGNIVPAAALTAATPD
ncbi:MAG: imidazolonepropionase [Candidatus Neomarinimicrobiota bacterium]